MNTMKAGTLNFGWRIALVLLPVVTAFICLGIGRVPIPAGDILAALTGSGAVSSMTRMTIWNLISRKIIYILFSKC